MTKLDKTEITSKLQEFVERIGSGNKAANALSISSATISQILNGKTDLVSEDMWKKIATQLINKNSEWVYVETRAFKKFTHILEDAKQNSTVFAVIAKAGGSKTSTTQIFAENNKEVFRVSCNDYWNRKLFLSKLLQTMGLDDSGLRIGEMMDLCITKLKQKDNPLIILDEADKLSDQVIYFFITLYNELEDNVGIVLTATDHLEKRIIKGITNNKKGYNEIFSRIGRRFIELPKVDHTDILQICIANGIDKDLKVEAHRRGRTEMVNAIQEIYEDSSGDIRRVKRKIHAIKSMSNNGE